MAVYLPITADGIAAITAFEIPHILRNTGHCLNDKRYRPVRHGVAGVSKENEE